MQTIRSATVLRGVRENIELLTEDGLTLVGELALPDNSKAVATLVTLHPLPTAGGFMDSHVLRKVANRLPELAQTAVLRFNTRGTTSPRGKSEGTFEEGDGERYDVAAALNFVRERGLPNPWLLGWSFGTELALKYGPDHEISGAILLSPPLHRTSEAELERWNSVHVPVIAVIPEHDDFLKPEPARERFSVAPRINVIPVEGGKHLWVGETQVSRVLNEVVSVMGTADIPLPTEVEHDRLMHKAHSETGT